MSCDARWFSLSSTRTATTAQQRSSTRTVDLLRRKIGAVSAVTFFLALPDFILFAPDLDFLVGTTLLILLSFDWLSPPECELVVKLKNDDQQNGYQQKQVVRAGLKTATNVHNQNQLAQDHTAAAVVLPHMLRSTSYIFYVKSHFHRTCISNKNPNRTTLLKTDGSIETQVQYIHCITKPHRIRSKTDPKSMNWWRCKIERSLSHDFVCDSSFSANQTVLLKRWCKPLINGWRPGTRLELTKLCFPNLSITSKMIQSIT